jgi:hypothetical protein
MLQKYPVRCYVAAYDLGALCLLTLVAEGRRCADVMQEPLVMVRAEPAGTTPAPDLGVHHKVFAFSKHFKVYHVFYISGLHYSELPKLATLESRLTAHSISGL